jgi:hypothetical protein
MTRALATAWHRPAETTNRLTLFEVRDIRNARLVASFTRPRSCSTKRAACADLRAD